MQSLLLLMINLESSKKICVWDGLLQAAPRLTGGCVSTSFCYWPYLKGKKLESTAFSYFLSFIFSLPHFHFKADLSSFSTPGLWEEGCVPSMDELLSCLRLLTRKVIKNKGKQIVSNGGDTLAAKNEKNEDPERLYQV